MDLHGKTTIVTGGGTGLGKSISLKMAAAGAAVAVNYPGADEDEAKETVAEICSAGGEALPVRADVSVSSEVRVQSTENCPFPPLAIGGV